jgi:acyl carrier protein
VPNRTEIYDRLHPIFREYFEMPSLTVTDKTAAADVEGWDSLAHVSIVVAIEKEFGIQLGVKHSSKLKNVGELVDAISARVKT